MLYNIYVDRDKEVRDSKEKQCCMPQHRNSKVSVKASLSLKSLLRILLCLSRFLPIASEKGACTN